MEDLTPEQLRMIEENRKKAQERKRKREEAMNETPSVVESNRVSFAPPDEGLVAKQNQAKRVQMEQMGFAISYAGNDEVEINDDDLDGLADEIEEKDSQINS